MTNLHPADAARVERTARTIANGGRCDHGRQRRECLICIELEHAERGSVTLRAAYAFGDFPPIRLVRTVDDLVDVIARADDVVRMIEQLPVRRHIRGLPMGGLRARIAAGPPASAR